MKADEALEMRNDYTDEEYALGLTDCECPFDEQSDQRPCISCGARVKYIDHIHFKGELFHEWCLLIVALRQFRAARTTKGEE